MFGARKTRPPLSTNQRLDLELLMRRTMDVLGKEAITECEVVTDIRQLSLDHSDPSALLTSADEEVRRCLGMSEVHLGVEIVDAMKLGYASTYRAAASEGCSTIISVADDTAGDPLRTVIELAYQYSYHFWCTRPDPRPLDIDPRTTNLLPVCRGLGVLASDASLYDKHWSQAGFAGWSITRSGYYSAVELGYALALWGRARGERDPEWAGRLRPDSRVTAVQAWRYFENHTSAGGQLLFDAEKIPGSDRDMNELADWLSGNDATFALAAAYALAKFDDFPPLVVQAALAATHSGDRDLVPVAVRLLAGARHESPEVIARVERLIRSRHPATSLAAIQSADALGFDLTPHCRVISRLLDRVAEDAFGLLSVIGNQGHRLAALESQICDQIVQAIKHVDDDLLKALLQCLSRIVDDPEKSLNRWIKLADIRGDAIDRLESVQG